MHLKWFGVNLPFHPRIGRTTYKMEGCRSLPHTLAHGTWPGPWPVYGVRGSGMCLKICMSSSRPRHTSRWWFDGSWLGVMSYAAKVASWPSGRVLLKGPLGVICQSYLDVDLQNSLFHEYDSSQYDLDLKQHTSFNHTTLEHTNT